MVEIEQKFRGDGGAKLRTALREMNAAPRGRVTQRDVYYSHPSRDFAATDEALRLRTIGNQTVITYKGPREISPMKVRREVELPVTSPHDWGELLELLGFRPVAVVGKERESWQLQHDTMNVEVCCDSVDGLGKFVEIEVVAEQADVAEAQTLVLELAETFGLTSSEPRSYLEMILQSNTGR